MPRHAAMPLAVVASAVVAVMVSAFAVLILYFVFKGLNPPDTAMDVGDVILLVVIVINIAFMAFIASTSILVNLHHDTTWLTPTLSSALCALLVVWMAVQFDARLAPFTLGGGILTWLISCWLLRPKPATAPENVPQA